jgi:wyosine [tRNA(Phe)-imidazoG37] synthetase (radical SAM superfamily)
LTAKPLTTQDHSRDSAGLTYVYPVISRRSRGLSIGINLNPNNACNWRCLYCQVPNLVRGAAPDIDLDLLHRELRTFLHAVLHGDFFERRRIETGHRVIRDIAISGNGEPTSAKAFDRVIGLIGATVAEFGLMGKIRLVLITNGSLVTRPVVQSGLTRWADLGGEVWFKLDGATEQDIQRVNQVNLSLPSVRRNLETAARLCPVWLQTCVFSLDGEPPAAASCAAYLAFLADLRESGVPLKGVLLYGLARPSMQPEAPRLAALPAAWLERYAEQIRELGLPVDVSA